MCVLSILSIKKSYGYMKELEVNNLKLKGVGSIYPILTKLKNQEWVNTYQEVTDSGKVRIYYEINENGKIRLEKKINEWLELQSDIQTLLKSGLKGDLLK
ncbi:PadR family transcriptional regulator [Bacillus cereus]|uniref:PadR family transcriptional regulator n=1 Tax=Bacillus TaxID=1386 RepID=UPI0027E106AC|nr:MULTISPECIES: PadR family transcriptional regulator [unclassified Bacillus (in: firmicutes)]